ncbi:MAG: hypothetical protein ACK526_13125 [Planctomyces sp.]
MPPMHRYRNLITLVVLLTPLVLIADGSAGGHRCSHCRCEKQCTRVCRLVREDRKITTTCWGCECEEFCIPGPSSPGCEHCETVCGNCTPSEPSTKGAEGDAKPAPPASKKKVYSEPKRLVWTDWIPDCRATVHTKKKLMKRTVTKTVPSWKWVVVDLCEECQPLCPDAPVEPGAKIPPKPLN